MQRQRAIGLSTIQSHALPPQWKQRRRDRLRNGSRRHSQPPADDFGDLQWRGKNSGFQSHSTAGDAPQGSTDLTAKTQKVLVPCAWIWIGDVESLSRTLVSLHCRDDGTCKVVIE